MILRKLGFVVLLLSVIQFSCSKQEKITKPIKAITFHTETYELDWQEIELLERKGAGKSIVEKVDAILLKSKSKGNYPQVFKALAYRSKYINQIEEESTFKILSQYEEELRSAAFPLRSILHSALGELYFQYFNQNRWRFQNRTTTIGFEPKDLKTWSLNQIIDTANFHYLNSLNEKENLSQTPIKHLEQILNQTDLKMDSYFDGQIIRNNLYDFLAHRALDYFKLGNNRKNIPINEFKIDKYPVFSNYSTFINIQVDSIDKFSPKRQTLLIFQEILKNSNQVQKVSYDLNRLLHYYNVSDKEDKDSLYLKALNNLKKEYASHAEITYAIADLYFRWGNEFDFSKPESLKKQWYLKKAKKLLETIPKEDLSFGAKKAQVLINQIMAKQLQFNVEKFYTPSEFMLFQLQFKNIDEVFVRIIKAEDVAFIPNKYFRIEEKAKSLAKSKVLKEFKIALNTPDDLQHHSAEIMHKEKLEIGNYYLLVSANKDFNISENALCFQNFQVSKLAFITRNNTLNNGTEILVLDRENGRPVEKATIEVYNYTYDYNNRENKYVLDKVYKSDKNGKAIIPAEKDARNKKIKVSKDHDVVETDPHYFSYNYPSKTITRTITHLFSDRAIYRPGQIVYFKGIILDSHENNHQLKPEYNIDVSLHDVHGKEVEKTTKKTNDYGSFEGFFTLPNKTLNGSFQIRTKHGSLSIKVEDYKRPSFKINIDTLSGEPKLGSIILIEGSIDAFAGNTISDAKINYRIVRHSSFRYWSWNRQFLPPSSSKEIKSGQTYSDKNGKFDLSFIAEKDPSISNNISCLYNYEVSITAVSPSGETQSYVHTINLSSQSLLIETNLKEINLLSDLKELIISCKNANQKLQHLSGQLELYALKSPKEYSKVKYWKQSDLKLYPRNEFKRYFPNYSDTSSLNDLALNHLISMSSFKSNEKLNLFNSLSSGAYLLKIEILNRDGELVSFEQRFRLVNPSDKHSSFPDFELVHAIKDNGEPGDTAVFLISSSLDNLMLNYEVELDEKVVNHELLRISNSQLLLRIPIMEKHRGGFAIHLIGVHSNRIINHTERIHVPFSDKELNLKLTSFREKTRPGAKEKWTIEILNQEKKAENAELMLSMYDQSLDQFIKKDWFLNPFQSNRIRMSWGYSELFGINYGQFYGPNFNQSITSPLRVFPSLNWFGFSLGNSIRHYGYMNKGAQAVMLSDENMEMKLNEHVLANVELEMDGDAIHDKKSKNSIQSEQNPIRTNFNETVFFYPQLKSSGKSNFEFKMPDALTKWKFRAFAHTKDLKIGVAEQSIQTQKELMVFPNSPRFFREEDELTFSVLVSNLSGEVIDGKVKIEFFNGLTSKSIDIIEQEKNSKPFFIKTGENQVVKWKIKIPKNIAAIGYRVIAETEKFSDGEEKIIPVLLNRMMVTESLPLPIRAGKTKTFTFSKLLQSNQELSLENKSLTLEFTPNPVWYAIQALPYITEKKSACSEQIFARLYANAIAHKITESNPKIKDIYSQWKLTNSKELISKLDQNQELKSILIEETPWLKNAESESEQKSRIALLFDYNRMSADIDESLESLMSNQSPNGGWPWYKGMRDNRYITQYIVSGIGHLKSLGIAFKEDQVLQKAINYMDERIIEDYEKLIRDKRDLSINNLSYDQIYYLYARSFFIDIALPTNKTAFNYYIQQATEFGLKQSIYSKGMIALALNRFKPANKTSLELLKSLEDFAIFDDEMGMYWKSNSGGYYWHNAKIETHALLIEAFDEITHNQELVDELKIWLLKQKQTQAWPSSKSTAVACYALLMRGTDLLKTKGEINIQMGTKRINSEEQLAEPGTGYFKKQWLTKEVKPEMGNIIVENKNSSIAWGAIYWQYHQDLDQISSSSDKNLVLSKTLFKAILTNEGQVLQPIKQVDIKPGDKVVTRLRIDVDRDLEFIHLKDMRASSLEPIEVLSGYRYQDGLGYYQTVKDASTNFFFDNIQKGTYVFEYSTRATQVGRFSNGISSIQCLYAPEYSSHSQGDVLIVEE